MTFGRAEETIDMHDALCDINLNVSTDKIRMWSREIWSHEFTSCVSRRRFGRRDYDCTDLAKCNKRLMGAGSQFLQTEDCIFINLIK
jgi:hypothetical protein